MPEISEDDQYKIDAVDILLKEGWTYSVEERLWRKNGRRLLEKDGFYYLIDYSWDGVIEFDYWLSLAKPRNLSKQS